MSGSCACGMMQKGGATMSEGAMSKGAMRDPAWPAVVCWHTTDMSLSAHTMPTCLLGAVLGHLLPVNNPALGITGLVCCSGGSLALRWVAARVELQAHTGRQARRYCHQPRRPPRRCRCCSTARCFAEAAAARRSRAASALLPLIGNVSEQSKAVRRQTTCAVARCLSANWAARLV